MNIRKIEFALVLACFFISAFLLIENLGNLQVTGFSVLNEKVSYAPHDFIQDKDIEVKNGSLVLDIKNYTIDRYNLSDSMEPTFGNSANTVGIKPKSVDDIHVGDIIVFNEGDDLVAHRVIEKGADSKGMFFITKGDNNNIADGKVRFEDIKSVIVAIIY